MQAGWRFEFIEKTEYDLADLAYLALVAAINQRQVRIVCQGVNLALVALPPN
jgi:hypothetical protein